MLTVTVSLRAHSHCLLHRERLNAALDSQQDLLAKNAQKHELLVTLQGEVAGLRDQLSGRGVRVPKKTFMIKHSNQLVALPRILWPLPADRAVSGSVRLMLHSGMQNQHYALEDHIAHLEAQLRSQHTNGHQVEAQVGYARLKGWCLHACMLCLLAAV